MVLRHLLIATLAALLPLASMAQAEPTGDVMEDWMAEGGSEEEAADMADMLLQLRENPVNVNDTIRLASLPLITPFQRRAICNYIILHGQLLSLKELKLIPGFDSATCASLAPYVAASPFDEPSQWKPWQGRHTILTGMSGTLEQAEGYWNGALEGDNLRAMFRYTYNYRNQLSIRLCADKDPGEAWGRGNYYGYHLTLSNIGRLDKLIVGRFNLQFGQGLTLWTGLRPIIALGETPLLYGTGVKPAATFYEAGYQEGVAATVTLARGVDVSAFASKANGENLTGGHLAYHGEHVIVGVTAAHTMLDDSLQQRDRVYNQNRFRGDRLLNLGVDALWQWRRLTVYGEATAATDTFAPAAIVGVQLRDNSHNMLDISYRYNSPFHHNLHSQGYAIGNGQGERGITLDARTLLPLGIEALVSLDLHNFSNLRSDSYFPSSGSWLRVQLRKNILRTLQASVRYSHRQKERNIPNLDTTLYLGERTLRQLLQAELSHTSAAWRTSLRAAAVRFDSESGGRQTGWMVGATTHYSRRSLQATAGIAYFDVDDYYARLYFYEANLQHFWTMPALYGRGFRLHALLRYAVSDRLELAGKYAVTDYPDQESVGSGDNRTQGSHRQTVTLQLQWKL